MARAHNRKSQEQLERDASDLLVRRRLAIKLATQVEAVKDRPRPTITPLPSKRAAMSPPPYDPSPKADGSHTLPTKPRPPPPRRLVRKAQHRVELRNDIGKRMDRRDQLRRCCTQLVKDQPLPLDSPRLSRRALVLVFL